MQFLPILLLSKMLTLSYIIVLSPISQLSPIALKSPTEQFLPILADFDIIALGEIPIESFFCSLWIIFIIRIAANLGFSKKIRICCSFFFLNDIEAAPQISYKG